MLAAAALMFAACAQFDTVNEVPESEPQAIGFDTYAQMTTRATENNEGTYNDSLKLHHDNFAVWAFKNTSTVPVFGADPTIDPTTGTTVNANDYSYDDLKYWDKTADNYYFYAAAPVTATEPKWTLNGVTDIATQKDGYFTISNVTLQASNFRTAPDENATTTFKSADKDKDLMIAAPNTTKFEEVQLKFIHILSRLNIIVKKATGLTPDPTITLNSVKVYGINLKGSFNESTAASTAGSIARWTPAATPVTTNQYAYISDLALTTDDQYIIESLVIPQNVDFEAIETDGTTVETKPYLEVIYTINGEQYKAYYNLAATFGKTAGQSLPFNEGWQNTLTITISPASITFAGNVSTWSETPGAQPID